ASPVSSRETPRRWSQSRSVRLRDRSSGQHDAVAELLQSVDVMTREPVRCQFVKMVGAEISIAGAVAEQVVRRHQDAVADGHRRLLLTATSTQTAILGTQVRSLAAAGTPTRLQKERLEPSIALACLP